MESVPLSSQLTATTTDQATDYLLGVFDGKNGAAAFYNSEKSERKTAEYGYSFRSMRDGNGFSLANPIPELLSGLYLSARDSLLSHDSEIPYSFDTCLVNLYGPGVDLFPHVDKDEHQAANEKRPFYFGSKVIGVILIADTTGKLYVQNIDEKFPKTYNPSSAIHLNEVNGTSYLLSGLLRYRPWHHGVSRVAIRRLSVTFRTLYYYDFHRNTPGARVRPPISDS